MKCPESCLVEGELLICGGQITETEELQDGQFVSVLACNRCGTKPVVYEKTAEKTVLYRTPIGFKGFLVLD